MGDSQSLPSWNDGAPKSAILDFVARVTKQGGSEFVQSRTEPGDRMRCPPAGYRWIKSHAWMPDFDTCEPFA